MKKRRLYSSIAALSLFVAAMTFGPLVNGAAVIGEGDEETPCKYDPGDKCSTEIAPGITVELTNYDERD